MIPIRPNTSEGNAMIQDPPYSVPLRIVRNKGTSFSITDAHDRTLAYVHYKALDDPLRGYGYAGTDRPLPLDEEGAVRVAQAIARALS